MRSVHDRCAVLQQKEVRQQLDVLGRILDLIPLSLHARSEVPIPRRPPANTSQRLQIIVEMVTGQLRSVMISISDGIHDESHAHDPCAMDQAGARRGETPGILEGIGRCSPVGLEDPEHGLHIT